jgi:hypothetical protein
MVLNKDIVVSIAQTNGSKAPFSAKIKKKS